MTRMLKVVAIVVGALLLVAGGLYAYQVLWSGEASITIESVDGGTGKLEIASVTAESKGSWSDAADTWTVSLARGESARLRVTFENSGDDIVTYSPYINGHELSTYVATGVRIQTVGDLASLAAGETGHVTFVVDAMAEAESGSIPDVILQIRET